jgi:hypothetical protein
VHITTRPVNRSIWTVIWCPAIQNSHSTCINCIENLPLVPLFKNKHSMCIHSSAVHYSLSSLMQVYLQYRLVKFVTVTVHVSEIFHPSFFCFALQDFHARIKVKMHCSDFVLSQRVFSCNWQINVTSKPSPQMSVRSFNSFWLQHVSSKSKSKSCYDWRSVHSGTCDQILFSVWKLLCCLCGAPSLTRGRVCLLSVTVVSV